MPSAPIPDDVVAALCEWASSHDAVQRLWLFGSRAKGNHRPDSDTDLAIELCPAKGDHDWALGEYFSVGDDWKVQLSTIARGAISLVAFRDDIHRPFDPREGGVCIWTRR